MDPPTITIIASGTGEVTTPISYDNSGNIYWGTWSNATIPTTGIYYQYIPSTNTLNPFSPANSQGYYWAGAVFVTVGSAGYMVFGSDSGTVYVRPVTNFSSGTGYTHTVPASDQNKHIRSSIALLGGYLYFTSAYSNTDVTPFIFTGKLWRLATSSLTTSGDLSNPVELPGASTSTPVVSNNSFVYVGWYRQSTGFVGSGGVVTVPVAKFLTGSLVDVYGNGVSGSGVSGDMVQSSPLVRTIGGENYIYFTTNASNGKGYCYQHTPSSAAAQFVWSAGGTIPTPYEHYTLQGFAANNGYLIYGDDASDIYIMH